MVKTMAAKTTVVKEIVAGM
jgi:hypothetical protein